MRSLDGADGNDVIFAKDTAFVVEAGDGDEPWMLNINIYDPHPPFIPPQVYADQFDPADMPGPYFRQSDLERGT